MSRLLRKAAVRIHNERCLEVFSRSHAGGIHEIWVVGIVGTGRRVINHYLTHDELERRLAYAREGDIDWRDAVVAEIPRRSSTRGLTMGRTIPGGKVVDCERLAYHLPLAALAADRKVLAVARRCIQGRWSDGRVVVTFGPMNALQISGPISADHPFAVPQCCSPSDWWRMSVWQLHLMSRQGKRGTRVAVLRVDEQELHVAEVRGRRTLDTIAHVFRRAKVGASRGRRRTRG